MDETIRKRINLLIHLAMADGKYHKSEKELIDSLIAQHGMKDSDFKHREEDDSPFFGIQAIGNKEELIYLALKLIKIDGSIHSDEIAFCKAMALKLRFSPNIIDSYVHESLPEIGAFIQNAQQFRRP